MEAICMCVYTVKLPPDTLPPWRQFGCRQCDLRPPRLHRVVKYQHCYANRLQIIDRSAQSKLLKYEIIRHCLKTCCGNPCKMCQHIVWYLDLNLNECQSSVENINLKVTTKVALE